MEIDKVKIELEEFWNEIFIVNRPRYKDWKQWHHLWIDFWNAFFDMNYTLGHIVGIGIPLYFVYKLYTMVIQ